MSGLGRRVNDVSRVQGDFVLRSGRTAAEYFDKYQFEADPALLDTIAGRLAALVPPGTEVLAGLEMGGIAVVTALGRHTGLPCAFVRKRAKPYRHRAAGRGDRGVGASRGPLAARGCRATSWPRRAAPTVPSPYDQEWHGVRRVPPATRRPAWPFHDP
jgi:hypothetical protein